MDSLQKLQIGSHNYGIKYNLHSNNKKCMCEKHTTKEKIIFDK